MKAHNFFPIQFWRLTLLPLFFVSLFMIHPISLVRAEEGNFVWAKAMGGTFPDRVNAIFADSSGNVYTTGFFDGTVDFDPGPGLFNLTSQGARDIFISKLDSGGNFVWAKAMGGPSTDTGNAIFVDPSGNVYTTGYFGDTVDFDPGPGLFNLTASGGVYDIFVSKLDSGGNFVWAKAMGGGYSDIGNAIFVDSSGNVYTTGIFYLTVDFDPGPGSYNLTSAGESDFFISKLDSGGNFAWAKAIGGTLYDGGTDIAFDTSGSIFILGYFMGTVDIDPGPGVFNVTSNGQEDIFIGKLDNGGNFVWAKAMGGTSEDNGRSIIVDTSGNIYTTGYFNLTADFEPGPGSYDLTSAGSSDIFVSKLDSDGNFVWAKAMGGPLEERGYDISVDTSGNVYTTGYFYLTVDFDPGPGSYNLTSAGESDFFISKLNSGGNFALAKAMGGALYDNGTGIAVDPSGDVYTTGSFEGAVDFDPGPGSFNLTSAGSSDIFVIKLAGPFPWPMFLPAINNNPQP